MPQRAKTPMQQLLELLDEPTPLIRQSQPRSERVDTADGDSMTIPHPPQYQPPIEAIGNPFFARVVEGFRRQFPGIQGNAHKIVAGPDPAVSSIMLENLYSPDMYDQTSLMGTTDFLPGSRGNITINPRITGTDNVRPYDSPGDNYTDLLRTLAHELTHAMGYRSDNKNGPAYRAGEQAVQSPFRPAMLPPVIHRK